MGRKNYDDVQTVKYYREHFYLWNMHDADACLISMFGKNVRKLDFLEIVRGSDFWWRWPFVESNSGLRRIEQKWMICGPIFLRWVLNLVNLAKRDKLHFAIVLVDVYKNIGSNNFVDFKSPYI